MDVNEKLQQFGQSLEEISGKEYKQIEEEVDKEIKSGIEEEVKIYENKKQTNFDKISQRIEKDYNKKVYNYEIQCKKEIIDEQKKLKENLKIEIIKRLNDFVKTNEYENFLLKSIDEGLAKIEKENDTCIGITKLDFERYNELITNKYNIKIKEIEEKYIGGCILENTNQGIFIDNTLLNRIDEKLKG